jgi:hypothetical protein
LTANSRLRFPRKAAFFTLIAAEAMSHFESSDAGSRASNLYLASSQLYSREGNEFEHGGEKMTRYGWCTLRSESLRGLCSQPSDKTVAEAGKFNAIFMKSSAINLNATLTCNLLSAIELLMALLSEISPDQVQDNLLMGQLREEGAIENQRSFEHESKSFNDASYHGVRDGTPIVSKTKQVSKPLASMTTKTPFFSQAPPSALSLSQSKWLEDDPIPHVQLPFVDAASSKPKSDVVVVDRAFADRVETLSSLVNTMKCVRTLMPFTLCSKMQQLCIVHLQELRQQMAASSGDDEGIFSLYGQDHCLLPPPLIVTSAKIVKAESHLVLERTKALGYSAKFATHSMSTFFNPYAKNKSDKDKNKVQTTLIAEGEERAIMIEFKV